MRVGYLSFFRPEWHTEHEIADHLESVLGWEVVRFHLPETDKHEFLGMCPGFDMVITALPHLFRPEFWRSVKAAGPILVAWYFDWIFGHAKRDRMYVPPLRAFDLTISTDGFEDRYARYGIKRYWLPHGVDTRVYKPVIPNPAITVDVGFIGHAYTERRRKMLRRLLETFNTRMFGMDDECWGRKYSEICSSIPIIVADNFRNDVPGYWSDRLYLSLASGAFLLHPRVGGIENYFIDGEHLILWDNERDLHNKIVKYLGLPEERKYIASQGAEEAAKNHSWAIRVKEFEGLLCESGLSDTPINHQVSASSAGSS